MYAYLYYSIYFNFFTLETPFEKEGDENCFFFLLLPRSKISLSGLALPVLSSDENEGEDPPIRLLATLLDCLPLSPKHFSK